MELMWFSTPFPGVLYLIEQVCQVLLKPLRVDSIEISTLRNHVRPDIGNKKGYKLNKKLAEAGKQT